MSISNFIPSLLLEARELLSFIEQPNQLDFMAKATQWMVEVLEKEGTLYSCGNGGSFCDALHFAEELSGRYRDDRPALRAMAFSDGAHISCVANDYGYDMIFARAIEAYGRSGDLLLAISTSGNSLNVIKAVEAAHKKGIKTIGLLGKDGGKLKDLVDLSIVVPSKNTERIQEIHTKLIHFFIEGIERTLFPHLYGHPTFGVQNIKANQSTI